MTSSDPLLLLIRIKPVPGATAGELYEQVRTWWRTTLTQAQRAERVLAVVDGQVVEVYTPFTWSYGPAGTPDADRVGFSGDVSRDRDRWVGRDLKHLFKQGAANPVRYLPASALETSPASPSSGRDLALLLRLNQTWYEGIPAEELYEAARAWWVLSAANAERVDRVLAVAGGVVREVYEPAEWMPSPVPGLENRIGFEGTVADDRDAYVGVDVAHLFLPGSANPVRYLPLASLVEPVETPPVEPVETPTLPEAPAATEPGLLERVLPLLDAFENDLLWAQSKAAQELFHSNTIGWLLAKHQRAMRPVLELLGDARYEDLDEVKVWRERKNLDIVIDPVGCDPKVVVENKLYSIPYPEQLEKYRDYKLPWSENHGPEGAENTTYMLLSVMKPSFPLPGTWQVVTYEDLAGALDRVDVPSLGAAGDAFESYRALVHRLVALSEAVAPSWSLEEPFSVEETVKQLPGGGLDGSIAKLRFAGLSEVVQAAFTEVKPFVLDGKKGGIMTYWRQIAEDRFVGWQLEQQQLRLQVQFKAEDLQGTPGIDQRALLAETEHLDFFEFGGLEAAVGTDLGTKVYEPGQWNRFNPDFVYRYRPITKTISTAALAAGLVHLTRHVDAYADASGWVPRG